MVVRLYMNVMTTVLSVYVGCRALRVVVVPRAVRELCVGSLVRGACKNTLVGLARLLKVLRN